MNSCRKIMIDNFACPESCSNTIKENIFFNNVRNYNDYARSHFTKLLKLFRKSLTFYLVLIIIYRTIRLLFVLINVKRSLQSLIPPVLDIKSFAVPLGTKFIQCQKVHSEQDIKNWLDSIMGLNMICLFESGIHIHIKYN